MADGRPRRRFTVEIEVSGDSWEHVQRGLQDLLPHIEDHGPQCSSVSGGYSSGHWIRVTENPEMTPQKYRAEVESYVAGLKAQKETADG
jgi:hypothetical protein